MMSNYYHISLVIMTSMDLTSVEYGNAFFAPTGGAMAQLSGT